MSNLNNDISLENLIEFMDNDPMEGEDNSPSAGDFDTTRIFGNSTETGLDDNPDNNINSETDSEKDNLNTDPNADLDSSTQAQQKPVVTVPDPNKKDEGTTDSPYQEYFNLLDEYNMLHVPEDFKFDGTAESFAEALSETSKNLKVKSYSDLWEALPDEWKPGLQYALSGGDINKYLETFQSNSLENLDLSDTENQRLVIKQYYKSSTDISDEKINRLIERLHIIGDLESEAEKTLKELKEDEAEKRNTLAKQQADALKAEQERERDARLNIYNLIDSSEYVETPRKGKLKAYMYNELTDSNEQSTTLLQKHVNNIANNHEHYVQFADLLMSVYDPMTGFNLDRYTKQGASKATKTLKERLEAITNNKTHVSGSASKVSSDNFDWTA